MKSSDAAIGAASAAHACTAKLKIVNKTPSKVAIVSASTKKQGKNVWVGNLLSVMAGGAETGSETAVYERI